MHRYAVLDADGLVVNIVVLDLAASPDWAPGEGLVLHPVPDEGAMGQAWTGTAFVDTAAPAPSGEMIDAERDRRIALPLAITLTGDRTFSVNMDDQALRNMNGLATGAVLAKVLGSTDTVPFITYANDTVELSPDDVISLGLQVQARISAITFAGRAIKDTSPIPADYTDDSYWQ